MPDIPFSASPDREGTRKEPARASAQDAGGPASASGPATGRPLGHGPVGWGPQPQLPCVQRAEKPSGLTRFPVWGEGHSRGRGPEPAEGSWRVMPFPFSTVNQQDSHTEPHQGPEYLWGALPLLPLLPPSMRATYATSLIPHPVFLPPGAPGSLHPSHSLCESWDLSAFVLGFCPRLRHS